MFLHTLRITAGAAMDFDFAVFLKSIAAIGEDIFYGACAFPQVARIGVDTVFFVVGNEVLRPHCNGHSRYVKQGVTNRVSGQSIINNARVHLIIRGDFARDIKDL